MKLIFFIVFGPISSAIMSKGIISDDTISVISLFTFTLVISTSEPSTIDFFTDP